MNRRVASCFLPRVLDDIMGIGKHCFHVLGRQLGIGGKEVVQVWLEWAKGCSCDPEQPDSGSCAVHQWLAACDDFIGLIDDHWYRIADQYRAAEAGLHGLEVQALWEPPEQD